MSIECEHGQLQRSCQICDLNNELCVMRGNWADAETRCVTLKSVMRERDALRARIDAAPTLEITECNQIPEASDYDFGDMSAAVQNFKPGQRVALVVVE